MVDVIEVLIDNYLSDFTIEYPFDFELDRDSSFSYPSLIYPDKLIESSFFQELDDEFDSLYFDFLTDLQLASIDLYLRVEELL